MIYEPVVGLEVHAELMTKSKMFCSCPVVDSVSAEPNTAVCPVCAALPGVLPVLNQEAVAAGIKVALALGCGVAHTSLFARKNYFYPDLPKGYQISQYEYPLAEHGILPIRTSAGEKGVRIRRVHLEEDTGKLTHVHRENEDFSLVDLNRAGVPLLEIVSEPDLFSLEEVAAYAAGLRQLLRYLGVNSGDMEKGVIRFEANLSLRPAGSEQLGTRVEIKNLNSFRSMQRALAYEIERQAALLDAGEAVSQETLGWDEAAGVTVTQRSKEDAHDYRYFLEPDLPPLVVEPEWVDEIRSGLPELPNSRLKRLILDYNLPEKLAELLVEDYQTAEFFEETVKYSGPGLASLAANWITGELFSYLNQGGKSIADLSLSPELFAGLLIELQKGSVNQNTGKNVLEEMLQSGQPAQEIIHRLGLEQISNSDAIARTVEQVIDGSLDELSAYLAGKTSLEHWFFGQAMRALGGKANPKVLRAELAKALKKHSA